MAGPTQEKTNSSTAGKQPAGGRRKTNRAEAVREMRGDSLDHQQVREEMAGARGGAATLQQRLQQMPADQRRRQAKLIARARSVLEQTPADARGMVPGTAFTQAGVARLMEILEQRAGNGGGRGIEVVRKFLAPATEDEETVCGASVKKLQMFADRSERFGARGEGRSKS